MKRTTRGIIASGMLAASLTGCGGPNNDIEACPKGWDGPKVESVSRVIGLYSAIGRRAIDQEQNLLAHSNDLSDETVEAFTDVGMFYKRINGDERTEVACKGKEGTTVLNPSGSILNEAAQADPALMSEAQQLSVAITGTSTTTTTTVGE